MSIALLHSPEGDIRSARVPLARFQQTAVEGLQADIKKVASFHEERSERRDEIALRNGVMLLQAPTGSGKTLVLGRTIEGLRGKLPRKCVWFWFAPYSGLVSQTREALSEQCTGIRLREISKDREIVLSRDGDTFVQTWAAVASRNKEARKVRRNSEEACSLDDMIAGLKAEGFFIGVIIDEAHLNFGASATVAAEFYLQVLRPDFALLATATPNDDKLDDFERQVGIRVAGRITIDRQQVVDARLNKSGLMLGVLRFQEDDAKLIHMEQATLTAAWTQHEAIKRRLQEQGIAVSPLLLVQVEDQAKEKEDPVQRVRQKLEQIGVPPDTIRSHTSGEPDPEFHTLAYDPSVEVLIFKVAVATGFDAPRAWTLVSTRPNRGKEFGLQIVGRIMRVHPCVRAQPGRDALLDRGYVFLTDPDLQTGLAAAVDELKAVKQSIALLTDKLDIVEFGSTQPLLDQSSTQPLPNRPLPPKSAEDRQERLSFLIEKGYVRPEVANSSAAEQDKAILVGEAFASMGDTPVFGELPKQQAMSSTTAPRRQQSYPLRRDLPNFPKCLIREEVPDFHQISGDLTHVIAEEFCRLVDVKGELNRRLRKATLSLRDLFLEGVEERRTLNVRISNARVAQNAQLAFQFNDAIDPRQLKLALVQQFQAVCDEEGVEYTVEDLRRAIDLAVMRDPDALRNAMRAALRRHLRLLTDEEIPPFEFADDTLPTSPKSAYGVLPPNMNNEERAFAEFLDQDRSGTVQWWLRNPENTKWATRLVLPNGKRFFPDFVVGVANRSTPNSIALVEIKDDGVTGRLQADVNLMKIRIQHQEYKNVFWSYRENGTWTRAVYAEGLHRIVPKDRFSIAEMVYIS